MKKVVLGIHERTALSVEEVAAMLGVGRNTVYELIASNAIDSIKIGARRIIPADAVQKYIDRVVEEQRQRPPEYRTRRTERGLHTPPGGFSRHREWTLTVVARPDMREAAPQLATGDRLDVSGRATDTITETSVAHTADSRAAEAGAARRGMPSPERMPLLPTTQLIRGSCPDGQPLCRQDCEFVLPGVWRGDRWGRRAAL